MGGFVGVGIFWIDLYWTDLGCWGLTLKRLSPDYVNLFLTHTVMNNLQISHSSSLIAFSPRRYPLLIYFGFLEVAATFSVYKRPAEVTSDVKPSIVSVTYIHNLNKHLHALIENMKDFIK